MLTDPTEDFDVSTLFINDNDLRGEFSRMSVALLQWLRVLADVADARAGAKIMLTRTKKAVELSIRQTSAKMTDKTAEAEVEVNQMVIDCVDELQRAEYIEDRCKAVVESLRTKKSMIMCLGGLARTELEVDKYTT